jgi:hypothetical protein
VKKEFDIQDAFVMLLHAGAWIAATWFIFLHPDTTNFITWSAFGGTISTAYHWLMIKDSKIEDAPQQPQGTPPQ